MIRAVIIVSWAICLIGLSYTSLWAANTTPRSDKNASQIFKANARSIVMVVGIKGKTTRIGSGFFINSDGLIATSFHLIADAQLIGIKLRDGSTYEHVKVGKINSVKDLVLLKINKQNTAAVRLGNSDTLAIGDTVIAIGNPLGLENTISQGLLSGIRYPVSGFKVFQITAPISSGNSGGPLFDHHGNVVGITTATVTHGQNINFAVPINYLKPLIPTKSFLVSAQTPAHNTGQLRYTVKPHDTLHAIAKKFNTSVNTIMMYNGLKDSAITVGQIITVPRKE